MKKRNLYGYFFIAPFLLVFLALSIYPVLLTFFYTFTKFDGYSQYQLIGGDNWSRLITDKFFWTALGNTWKIWGLNIILQLGLALLLVMIFSDISWQIKGLGFFRMIFYLPNLITLASVAMLFSALLDWKYGALNQFLMKFGLISTELKFLLNPKLAQGSVSVIQAWMWFGNSFLFLMAGVTGISRDYFEAAKVDGANRGQMFRKVTLPLLKPVLLYVAITSIIGGMQLIDLPMLLPIDQLGSPKGSLNTMMLWMYNQAFRFKNFGYGATVAYGAFVLIAIFSAIAYLLMYGTPKKGGASDDV